MDDTGLGQALQLLLQVPLLVPGAQRLLLQLVASFLKLVDVLPKFLLVLLRAVHPVPQLAALHHRFLQHLLHLHFSPDQDLHLLGLRGLVLEVFFGDVRAEFLLAQRRLELFLIDEPLL